jgi:hypothetical protein
MLTFHRNTWACGRVPKPSLLQKLDGQSKIYWELHIGRVLLRASR